MEVGRGRSARDGKDVEMPGVGGHLIASDGSEARGDAHAAGRLGIVGATIVLRGDRQLDTFTGQREHPLVNGRVAVMAVRKGMDVRVATDQARRRHFVTQSERATDSLAAGDMDLLGGDAVVETARGMYRIS